MTINHLVLSGGGPAGFITYGALRELAKREFWELDNIKSIYGTSIGSFVGVIISLGYEWEWVDDYLTKRPWEKVANLTPMSFLDAFHKKGIVDESVVHDSIHPLFTAKDISADVTMKELYELNGIDIHIFATELNGSRMSKVNISHTTHPDIAVSKAIAMSAAFPFIFSPICYDGGCYIDGGVINNFPLCDCLEQQQCEESEVLAFKNIWIGPSQCSITDDSNMFDLLVMLLKRMRREIDSESTQPTIKNTVKCVIDDMNGFTAWLNALETEEMREALVKRGVLQATIFMEYITQPS